MPVDVKQDAIVLREKLAQIQPFDKSEYLSTYGTSLEGVDYTDPDAVGTNPTAKLYPDGTIVGSTDNGNYTKYPNGDLVCSFINPNITVINAALVDSLYQRNVGTLTFPVPFILQPNVNGDAIPDTHSYVWSSITQ